MPDLSLGKVFPGNIYPILDYELLTLKKINLAKVEKYWTSLHFKTFQFRYKTHSKEDYIQKLENLPSYFNQKLSVITNDYLLLAEDFDGKINIIGTHLGQNDMSISLASEQIKNSSKKDFLLGLTTHNTKEISLANKDENSTIHYIGCGPVFPTSTKSNLQKPILDKVGQYFFLSKFPLVFIGGITFDRIDKIKKEISLYAKKNLSMKEDKLKTLFKEKLFFAMASGLLPE